MADKWEEVVDKKKQRYERKVAERAANAEADAAQAAANHRTVYRQVDAVRPVQKKNKKKKKKAFTPDDDAFEWSHTKGAPNPVKAKSKGKANAATSSLDTPPAMVAAITNMLNGVVDDFVEIATISVRLSELTNNTWNARYKKLFGPIKAFLVAQKEFVVDEQDRLFLKATWYAVQSVAMLQ
jgi:hypothetical protein